MIPLAALGFASNVLDVLQRLFDFLKAHWKETLIIAGLLWAVLCTKFHCGPAQPPTVISEASDTVWVYPDTNAIFALHGFDTLPAYVKRLEKRKWQKPAPKLASAIDCSDSLQEYLTAFNWCDNLLDECDSMYRDATALRGYHDTIRNDSIELAVSLQVEGILRGAPVFNYRRLSPYPVVTNTTTIMQPIPRKVFVGAGAGIAGTYKRDFSPFPALSLALGYMDKQNRSYALTGDFSQNYWQAKFGVNFYFDLK